jgi:biopolymer transport protein ExbD
MTTTGKFGTMASEINITPMIDVLLVLLIIFMVIVPAIPTGEFAAVPKPALNHDNSKDPVVLEVLKGVTGDITFKINQHDVARQDLQARLAEIFANRGQRQMFVKGDDQIGFNQIAEVIDIGHAAGVDRIGLMTPQVQAGR